MVKNLPAMQETWVQSLGQEDPLEKEMATHSSILFFFFLTLQYCIGFAIYQHAFVFVSSCVLLLSVVSCCCEVLMNL